MLINKIKNNKTKIVKNKRIKLKLNLQIIKIVHQLKLNDGSKNKLRLISVLVYLNDIWLFI